MDDQPKTEKNRILMKSEEFIEVPEVDINAPLPQMQDEVTVDPVMSGAKREWNGGIVVFLIFVVAMGMIGWGIIVNNQKIRQSVKSVDQKVSDSSQPAQAGVSVTQQVSEPVKSVKPVFAVFNGSGIAGEAGRLKAKIESAGYEVVEIGNSENSQVGTTIELSSEVENQREEIQKILGLEKGAEPAGTVLAGITGTLKYNVKVIIGK